MNHTKQYILGIDIGTSCTKSVLYTPEGTPVYTASVEYPLYQPQPGWAEQNPRDWVNATFATIREIVSQSGVAPEEIVSVGLSGQMHGLVLLDEKQEPLRPSIIWCDQRTEKECLRMESILGRDKIIAITANPPVTGFTAAKILWVQKHEPELYEKTRKILLPKDYVRFALTGEFVSDFSDASGMQLMDVPHRCWSSELCSALGISLELLPTLCESEDISGRITQEAAAKCGLLPGTVVAGSAGDQAASAVGSGIVRPGCFSTTIGSSGVVFAYADKPQIDPQGRVHTLCHAVRGAWHVMGVTQGAGISLKWFRDTLCEKEILMGEDQGVDPYVLMDRLAAASPVGANGLLFLPYLMGERSPHLDPYAAGVFMGLHASHTKGDLIRAVMEGVTHSLTDCFEVISQLGFEAGEVRMAGGGSRSPLWRQMAADMFGTKICSTVSSEAGTLGAALLGACAAGIYKDVPEACDATIRTEKDLYPQAEAAAYYKKAHQVYDHLYPHLKNDYRELASLR